MFLVGARDSMSLSDSPSVRQSFIPSLAVYFFSSKSDLTSVTALAKRKRLTLSFVIFVFIFELKERGDEKEEIVII